MLFAIKKGKPYLIHGGRAFPVSIKDGTVTVDEDNAKPTTETGRYTLREVIAKLGGNVSSIKKKSGG